MIDFDNGVDPRWQARVLRYMCHWMLHYEDPEEIYQEWLNDGPELAEDKLRWVMQTWNKVSFLTSSSLEELAYQTNLWQAHQNFGSDQQRAP